MTDFEKWWNSTTGSPLQIIVEGDEDDVRAIAELAWQAATERAAKIAEDTTVRLRHEFCKQTVVFHGMNEIADAIRAGGETP